LLQTKKIDKESFYNVVWKSILIIIGSAICASTIQFFVDALAWKWRAIIYSKLQVNQKKNTHTHTHTIINKHE